MMRTLRTASPRHQRKRQRQQPLLSQHALSALHRADTLLAQGHHAKDVLAEAPKLSALVQKILGMAHSRDPAVDAALGWMYGVGFGVKKDRPRAVVFYERAAKQGSAFAQYILGLLYLRGNNGAVKDERKAAHWLGLAAKQKHPQAMFEFGRMLAEGTGVRIHRARALRLLTQAAEQGSIGAATVLGYQLSEGPQKDLASAVTWTRKAARRGEPAAMVNLGVFYARGEGVRRNIPRALHWYRKAAKLGDELAEENIRELEDLEGGPRGRGGRAR